MDSLRYGIAQAIRLKLNEVLQVETGPLYPALHRLERQRWLRSEWKTTESKQRARFSVAGESECVFQEPHLSSKR